MSRRREAILAFAGVLASCCLTAGCGWFGHDSRGCGNDEAVVDDPPAVFTSIDSVKDERVKKLADVATTDGFGPVVAGVGYDYNQWLSVASVPTGLAVWTKHDPVVSFLDHDLKPVWGLRQAKVPHAWTADEDTFYDLELSPKHVMWLSAYRLSDGDRRWCTAVGGSPTRNTDPYGTALLPSGSMVVLAQGKKAPQLTDLDTSTGKVRWTHTVRQIDRGDYIGDLGNGLILVGGRASYEVGDTQHPASKGGSLMALDEKTGKVKWRYKGGQVHVVGRSGGLIVLQQLTANGLELVGLDSDGKQRWRRSATRFGYDVATTGDMVVANTGSAFVGIDPSTGRQKWTTKYKNRPQYLPYGFQLAAQPMLDPRNILLAGTGALHALDARTGKIWDYPLPTDGLNTTYWPYQLAVSDRLLTIVTNTGAVVIDRDLA